MRGFLGRIPGIGLVNGYGFFRKRMQNKKARETICLAGLKDLEWFYLSALFELNIVSGINLAAAVRDHHRRRVTASAEDDTLP